jgi:hypothetical protein
LIIVVGGKALEIRLKCRLANPPVEIEKVWVVFVDDLGAAG